MDCRSHSSGHMDLHCPGYWWGEWRGLGRLFAGPKHNSEKSSAVCFLLVCFIRVPKWVSFQAHLSHQTRVKIWTQLSISFKVKSTNCMLIKVPVYLEIQGKIWPTNNSGLETFIWGSIDWGLTMYQGKHFPCTVSSNLANRQLVGYFYYLRCTHGVTETWKVE